MRRLCALLVPALLLAGCFGPDGPPVAPVASIHAGFPPGGLADVIRIDTVERLPLRSAELVAPDGALTPASLVDTVDKPSFNTGQTVANDPWKTGIAGPVVRGSPAIGAVGTGTALRSQAQILTMESTASIPLSDPVAYRRDWQHYRLRLGFGVPPGAVETREIAAPEPPPPAPAPPASAGLPPGPAGAATTEE
jgi:hypothetical protein